VVRGRLASGARIYLDLRDPSQREIYWSGTTEPGTTAAMRRVFQPGTDVVDVGANAGFYSLLCHDLGARRVLAFEPNPFTFRLLERSAAGTQIEPVRAACGDHEGSIALWVSPDPAKQAFSTTSADVQQTDDIAAWSSVDVPLQTVDQACLERDLRPVLVKVDAEGAESDVFRGMSRLLAERVPEYLFCEVAAGWERPDPSPWISELRAAGYGPRVIDEDGGLSVFERPIHRVSQNVMFVRA
jgi:FkbM family methyltransferase